MKTNPIKVILVCFVSFLFMNSCTKEEMLFIQKGNLKVDFYAGMPVFKDIIYREDTLKPILGKGLTINGELKEWKLWKSRTLKEGDTLVCKLNLPQAGISADFRYWLDSSSVHLRIKNVHDQGRMLKEIGLYEQPWVSIKDTSYRWWTVKNWTNVSFVNHKVNSRGIGYYNSLYGKGGDTIQKKGIPTFACIWNPKKYCVTVKTNMNVYPIHFWSDSGYCNLAPNIYYYRIKDKIMPDYEAQLAFISDLNQNHKADDSDYRLWCNRQMKGPDELHKNAIWYKIYLNDIRNVSDPCTTLKQAKEIITYINNITDGIPQIIYLVGWQYQGHDTGYPALDELNKAMGTKEELYSLSKYCDSLHSVLSVHANIDDAYKRNKYFSKDIMATDYDGSPMFWEVFSDSAFHISHYKDVATGNIFKRLEQFTKIFPIKRSIHFDAMRVTNCNPDWEKDKNGVLEEYELGLKPIAEWLNKRGILLTTETQNGNPIDLSPLVVGVYTYFHVIFEYKQLFHGKIICGGTPESMLPLRYSSGVGNSITQDFSYKAFHGQLPYDTERVKMKEIIYLSSILYHFLLTKEMIEMHRDTAGYNIRFSDGVTSTFDCKTNHLKVTWKDIVVADNDERFVPIHGGIYAYSKAGATHEWLLPENYRHVILKVFELAENGRKEFKNYRINNNKITLKLAANQSVKIVKE